MMMLCVIGAFVTGAWAAGRTSIAEVPCNVALRPGERNLIDLREAWGVRGSIPCRHRGAARGTYPCVQALQLSLCHVWQCADMDFPCTCTQERVAAKSGHRATCLVMQLASCSWRSSVPNESCHICAYPPWLAAVSLAGRDGGPSSTAWTLRWTPGASC
jgi:hypothetical protein